MPQGYSWNGTSGGRYERICGELPEAVRDHPFPSSEIYLRNLWQKEVTITHSYAADFPNLQTALTWIQHDRVNVAGMITHVFPLNETVEGFQLTARHRDGSLKVIMHPQE